MRISAPPSTLRLGPDEVHVWSVDLDPQPPLLEPAPFLSSAEQARAAQFVFAHDGRRYCASHVALRSILARYLSVEPSSLVFIQGPAEKPRLGGSHEIRFNLSHSGDLALVAVARAREVGVDVEQLREVGDLEGLAADCFASSELASWRGLPASLRKAAFFATWTRKEAYLKAGGVGLSRSLQSFEVSVFPGETPRLLRVADDPGGPARWTLRTLTVKPGFAATVVFEGQAKVSGWTWNPRDEHGSGRTRGYGHVHGGGEPRGAVLDLAGGKAATERLAVGRQDRVPGGVSRPHKGGMDGHAAVEPAGWGTGARAELSQAGERP